MIVHLEALLFGDASSGLDTFGSQRTPKLVKEAHQTDLTENKVELAVEPKDRLQVLNARDQCSK